MKNFTFVAVAILFAGMFNSVYSDEPYFQMRGVVLSIEDLESADWAKIAYENGINTIGTHISPSQVVKYAESEKGKKFYADCKKYGIDVEHQLHAMRELLPRNLFDEDPTMFRMDKSGKRVKEHNLCVHSQKALDIIAKNAADYAKHLPATNHRYYFWLDDAGPTCVCPECSKYSASEQALIVENRMIEEIRKIDSQALLAHLAYESTMPTPRKVKPADRIFLEFAPYFRSWDKPLADSKAQGRHAKTVEETLRNLREKGLEAGSIDETHEEIVRHLQENLTVFPAETTVILEYWLDVSLFSHYKKPAAKLPWHKDVFESDLKTYADLGIKNITSFAVYADEKYLGANPEFRQYLNEYGNGMKNYIPSKEKAKTQSYELTSVPIQDGMITIDGQKNESLWTEAAKIESFTNPWNHEKNPETSLLVLNDSQNFYFLFEVKDDELVLASDYSNERDNENEDRSELFFSKDKEMNEYYGFEIDPLGRTLSYQCRYYRNFDYDWDPPKGFLVVGKIHSDGYTIECAIPRSFLQNFVQDGGVIYFGAYRAEFRKIDGKIIHNWLTWKDPLTATPDFHVPASLGKLKIQDGK